MKNKDVLKQKMRKFVTSRPILQEILNAGLFFRERKYIGQKFRST